MIDPFMRLDRLEARAALLIDQGAIAEAVPLLRRALDLAPHDARRIANVASLLRMTGELAEATELSRRALRIDPLNILAVSLAADLCDTSELARLIPSIEIALDKHQFASDEAASLHYSCAKARHRMSDYEHSFRHASFGAAIRRATIKYDVDADIAVIDRIIATHRPPKLQSAPSLPANNVIFVSGLPRSGTTLMEQLVLRSGGISSIGERSNLQQAIGQEMRALALGAGNRSEAAANAAELNATRVFAKYIGSTQLLGVTSKRFVDKTPMNSLYAGLIAAAHGGVRHVMLKRDRRDVLTGIFRTDFHGLYPFALDLADLAKYVRAFDRLVAHWSNVLSSELFHVMNYERAVSEPYREIPAIFSFLGLQWHPNVLKSGLKNTIAVSASATQVRADVNNSSVGSWRNYEREISSIEHLLEV